MLCACNSVNAPPETDSTFVQTAKLFRPQNSPRFQLNYLLFLPQDYNAKSGQRWPLILFLHGAGERLVVIYQ